MDNYTKLRIIGSGSFGTVWLIRSKLNQRNYILKEIPLSMVQEKERAFVLNEVQVLSRLRHKNIIRYKEAFLDGGLLCISMEFASEGDLANKIQRQEGRMFPQEQVIDWFIQLCLSLKYIHGMNILHRDIKSQNIFLAKDSVIKLGDFGIARVLQNTLDHAQTVIGTPFYLSPEICQSQPYNHKSDIWALGCVLYEMITLKHPFESRDFTGLVLKILHGDYDQIPESHGPLLRDLVAVLLRVKPSERPSAKQILHIPAMKTHVDKVLARGRTQRSESVNCAPKETPVAMVRTVWRQPDVMCVEREIAPRPGHGFCEKKNRLRSNDVDEVWLGQIDKKMLDVENSCEDSSERKRGAHGNSEIRTQRKRRPSSVAFCSDNECSPFLEEETSGCVVESYSKNCSGETLEDKDNSCDVVQRVPGKLRSYSTSKVRETSERRPLMPLEVPPARLKGTYDLMTGQRRLRQETFTILENSESKSFFQEDQNISFGMGGKENSETIEGSCPRQRSKLISKSAAQHNEQNAVNFIKILLSNDRFNLGNVSLDDSISTYIHTLRCSLQRNLGTELFDVVYRYLATEAKKESEAGVDISAKLFEAMGSENIGHIPLVLHLVQCEKLFT